MQKYAKGLRQNKMHHDEIWQLYYQNGEPIVGKGWNAELGNPEVTSNDGIVGVAIVFLYRVNHEGELEFLWQRRSEEIDRYPGDWDFSAGGHVNLGESVVEAAAREAREEIGIKVDERELKFVTMYPFNKNRFAWVYLVNWTGKTDEFHFDDREVSEVKWRKYDEMDEFRKNYAKKPMRKDRLTFDVIDAWLRSHGNLQAD